MTRVISIVTAAHAPYAGFLDELSASVLDQRMPDGWDWQWVVQEDGETGDIAKSLPSDPRISAGTGRPGGPASARTLALARATGELVRSVDADDVLLPGALARDIDVLTRHRELGWVSSQALALHPDGSTRGWEAPAEGPVRRGEVLRHWTETDGLPPVVPGTLCIRRPLLLALGGWMALPGAEESGLLLAVSTVRDGYFIHEPSLLYRQHAAQTTAQPHHSDPTRREERGRLVVARAAALHDLVTHRETPRPGGEQPRNGRRPVDPATAARR